MRRGTKHLRIASVIQIVLGAVSAAAIYLMIGTEGAAAGVDPQAALAALLVIPYYYLHNAWRNYQDA